MDMHVANAFLEITQNKKELEKRVKVLNEELARIEEQLLKQMQDDGVSSVKIGGATVYLHHSVYARVMSGDEAAFIALKGYEPTTHLVKETVNANSMAAWVREFSQFEDTKLNEDGLPILPEEIRDHVKVAERFSVRVRGT